MSIDVIIAVWCLRVVGAVGVVTISVAIVMACLNYMYHSLVAALERELNELKLRKTLDNVRVKYGNEAVEDDE